jgi:hydroxypyruvate reductase
LTSGGGREDPRCVLIAAGKAAAPMTGAAMDVLGSRVRAGLAVAPDPFDAPHSIDMIVGEHPQPGEGSVRAGARALALAAGVEADELLLVLLSGGASSLMAQPADGVTLADKQRTTTLLLRAGADIHALNTLRKHLSTIKGGQLAAAARGACRTLAVSDVVGDDPSVIGSGPTVADRSTFADAENVLRRFGGLDAFPRAVVDRVLRGVRGEIADTPKPGDARLARAETSVIASRVDAMNGAATEARARGYHVVTIDAPVIGDARTAARGHLRDVLARAATLPRPLCVISSGETTVTVTGRGRGGRNQEFALAVVEPLESASGDVQLASIGTDGVDGPTDAAGAVADSTTARRARDAGLAPAQTFLINNDSYAYFEALGDLVRTGPTGTNVGDLQICLLTWL